MFSISGCLWHSCYLCDTNRNPDGNLKETHPVKKRPLAEIRQEALENKRRLEAEGFTVIEMGECQWKQLKKRAGVAAYVESLKSVQPKRQLPFDKILEGVRNSTLYGF